MSHNSVAPVGSAGSKRARTGLTVGGVAVSIVAAVVGVIVGWTVGANIGGNWMTGVSIGSLHGYEATSLIGAVLGGVTLGLLAFWWALRRPSK